MTEIDAERGNGLCHPISSTEPEDKGSVSASCFFQHLLDDNSYLSPHQRERRGERRKHNADGSSRLLLSARFTSPSSSFSRFSRPCHGYTSTVPLPLHAGDPKCSPLSADGCRGGMHRGELPHSGREVKGHA